MAFPWVSKNWNCSGTPVLEVEGLKRHLPKNKGMKLEPEMKNSGFSATFGFWSSISACNWGNPTGSQLEKSPGNCTQTHGPWITHRVGAKRQWVNF